MREMRIRRFIQSLVDATMASPLCSDTDRAARSPLENGFLPKILGKLWAEGLQQSVLVKSAGTQPQSRFFSNACPGRKGLSRSS
jgi:hypothetical protein